MYCCWESILDFLFLPSILPILEEAEKLKKNKNKTWREQMLKEATYAQISLSLLYKKN